MPNWKEVLEEIQVEVKKGVPNTFDIIRKNPQAAPLWQVIISKYHPTFLGECQNSIEWSEKLAFDWLKRNMCNGDEARTKKILKEFSDHKTNKTHAQHISKEKCKEIGVSVVDMEEDNDLQDLILTVHHSFMHTFGHTSAAKIVENHLGVAYNESLPIQIPMQMQQGQQPR